MLRSAIGAKLNWDSVCRPKNEGGLGLSKLEAWNRACLARLVWTIYCGKES